MCGQVSEYDTWHPREDSGKDNDRCSISDTTLSNEVSEPEEDHRTSGNDEHSREYDTPEITRIEYRRTIGSSDERVEEEDHPIALSESERNCEISSIIIDFLLSLFSLFLQRFERWDDDGEELDDDRSIDIRRKTHEDDRKTIESSSHE